MEQQPAANSNASRGERARSGAAANRSPRVEQYRFLWEQARRRGRRWRIGRFLYLTFAEMGVRAAAEVAARNEPDFLARQILVQQMIANWHATRHLLEDEK